MRWRRGHLRQPVEVARALEQHAGRAVGKQEEAWIRAAAGERRERRGLAATGDEIHGVRRLSRLGQTSKDGVDVAARQIAEERRDLAERNRRCDRSRDGNELGAFAAELGHRLKESGLGHRRIAHRAAGRVDVESAFARVLIHGASAPSEVYGRRARQQIHDSDAVELFGDPAADIRENQPRIAGVGVDHETLSVANPDRDDGRRSVHGTDAKDLAEMIGGVLRVLASVLARVAIVTRGHEHRVVVQHHEAAAAVTIMAYLQCGDR